MRELLKSRFNLLGPYNDDTSGASAARTRKVSMEKVSVGEFKVPSLRNLVLTAPYGRDGSVETIAEVVRHYANLDPVRLHAKDGKPAKPLNLTAAEQTDLVVFLESLSTFLNPCSFNSCGRLSAVSIDRLVTLRILSERPGRAQILLHTYSESSTLGRENSSTAYDLFT